MSPPSSSHYESREMFAYALRAFINQELPKQHSKLKESPQVEFDTPLFSSGIIDSMAILHLIAFVEDAIGRKIPPEKIVMKHFKSVTVIAATFWDRPDLE